MRLRSSRLGALGYLVSIHFSASTSTQSDLFMLLCRTYAKQLYISALTCGLIGYHKEACLQLSLSSFTGEVFLYNSRNLSEPQHNESYSGECRRESAVQAALLPQDHGAQAKQGTLIRSPI